MLFFYCLGLPRSRYMLRSLLSLKVEVSLLFLLLKFNSQQNACEQWGGMGHNRKGTKSSNDLSGGLSLFRRYLDPLYLGHVCPSFLDFNWRPNQKKGHLGSRYLYTLHMSWTHTFWPSHFRLCFFWGAGRGSWTRQSTLAGAFFLKSWKVVFYGL